MPESDADEPLTILVVSSLYPNPAMERHGIFVETRLRKLLERGGISAEVIAPVPWLPRFLSKLERYRQYRDIPAQELRNGISVHHPRYLVIPKIGMLLTPLTMAWCLFRTARRLGPVKQKYRLIDAHYYFPDGVAVALAAMILKLPYIVTARGTDINLIPERWLPRKLILWAARRASASVTVCKALKDRMVELGAAADKIYVLRNGVDLEKFRPMDREQYREQFGVEGKVLISVGHLTERKGHHLVIKALAHLKDYTLLIAGDGEMEAELRQLGEELGLDERVHFFGAVSQQTLAELYNAADALVLASSREGWANVLLESMACGTPVVATNIWGTPEVVDCPDAGVLVQRRTADCIADSIFRLFSNPPSRSATRMYAEKFSWDETITRLSRLIESCAS